MERDEICVEDIVLRADFNSHAHVERDAPAFSNPQGARISTHTLTWSVTKFMQVTYYPEVISTHTLTWSVTGEINPQAHWINNFNSHAHVERD